MPSPLNVRGISFPFRLGTQSFPERATGSSAFISSVKSLLFTGRGEVPMQPNLGTRLHDFIFEEMTPIRKGLLSQEVRRVLAEHIPTLRVLEVQVTDLVRSAEIGGARVEVNILYSVAGNVDNVRLNI